MTDRLQELLRQRASLQSHLDWLDREIVSARAASSALGASAATQATVPAVTPPLPTASTTPPAASRQDTPSAEIPAEYHLDQDSLRTDVRKGCLLYFFGALALLGLGILAFYFLNRLLKAGAS